ncbi:MAG TPA: pitrilysin family protein [Candidatus Babeliales bacterium]|nr:pitrilysin family protein [Candidatus Babeliales bacterium]
MQSRDHIRLLVLFFMAIVYTTIVNGISSDLFTSENSMADQIEVRNHVFKYILSNGMHVLVRVVRTIPKVSMQLWYKVGSKDEKHSEKGIAHLIEHMIFKGTDMLSESDINDITHMLSGSCNAFTSYDYTGYLFNMPTQHWKEILPVMADCMENVRFDKEMLASEMKAVIQELKMYKDHYTHGLIEELISVIFSDHPYNYPIIGFKQDLWHAQSDLLRAFYKKHYYPNNATLVVVGDVDPEDVYTLAEQQFGHIKPNPKYQKEIFYHNRDIVSKTVTLYRDIKQPIFLMTYVVPGVSAKQDHILTALKWVLGKGRSSRLQKKLVDDLQLVTSLEVGVDALFEYSLFFIAYEPKHIEDVPRIEQEILEEIQDIIYNGVQESECNRALHQMRMKFYSMLEDMEQQAYKIGEYFTATGDQEYVFTSFDIDTQTLCADVQNLVQTYLRPVFVHKGSVLSLPEEERETWRQLQDESDAADEAILSAYIRTTDVEPARYAKKIKVKKPLPFSYPRATSHTLDNGLKLLYYHNNNTPTVSIALSLRVTHYYDPDDKLGLGLFVAAMLTEGTKNYTEQEFADALESRGISFSAHPGGIVAQALKEDIDFVLEMIHEVLVNATFNEDNIEKVRAQLDAEIKNFWDEPRQFAGQLIKEHIYQGHPYSKNMRGTHESIASITRDDLIAYYKKYMSPSGATLAIVGDLEGIDVQAVVKKTVGNWTGPKVEKLKFPKIKEAYAYEINYPINRDQIVLAYSKSSISRLDPKYDALLLFNQIFGGGELGSMSSRLFQLRERSGLFYTISGSLIVAADEEPGMFMVKTIVSRDRLAEAEEVIKQEINKAAETITQEELEEAKRAVINNLVNYFAANSSMASAFLFLNRFNLPADYFDTRAAMLDAITIEDIQKAVKDLMRTENMLMVRVGRVPALNIV